MNLSANVIKLKEDVIGAYVMRSPMGLMHRVQVHSPD